MVAPWWPSCTSGKEEDLIHSLTHAIARSLTHSLTLARCRFTVQGEFTDCMAGEPCLLVWDLSIDPSYQRKGLGRHLLTLLELIARKTGVRCVSLPVMLGDDVAADWLTRGSGRKFVEDEGLEDAIGFSPEAEGFRVFSKEIAIPC